jgi:hypothetical protein
MAPISNARRVDGKVRMVIRNDDSSNELNSGTVQIKLNQTPPAIKCHLVDGMLCSSLRRLYRCSSLGERDTAGMVECILGFKAVHHQWSPRKHGHVHRMGHRNMVSSDTPI